MSIIGILHVFCHRFASRYRDLKKKTATLIGFQHPSCYGDILIRPSRKVFDELIIKEWSNIQRIMASLAHKDVTQATIVRKLSSYTRQNQTKKALWELDNLCRTLYILDFIDDPKLRQSVQKALNRAAKPIIGCAGRWPMSTAGNSGGEDRSRAANLERVLPSDYQRDDLLQHGAALAGVWTKASGWGPGGDGCDGGHLSPVAWQHVNLFGVIEFNRAMSLVDLDALAARYADPACWRKAFEEEEAA